MRCCPSVARVIALWARPSQSDVQLSFEWRPPRAAKPSGPLQSAFCWPVNGENARNNGECEIYLSAFEPNGLGFDSLQYLWLSSFHCHTCTGKESSVSMWWRLNWPLLTHVDANSRALCWHSCLPLSILPPFHGLKSFSNALHSPFAIMLDQDIIFYVPVWQLFIGPSFFSTLTTEMRQVLATKKAGLGAAFWNWRTGWTVQWQTVRQLIPNF